MIDPAFIAAARAAAEAAADLAATITRPLFRSGLVAEQKGDQSPVTKADRDAEQAMRALLAARFPEHGILGEEFGLDRPDSRLRWVLDPIDGTRAFITGRAQFGTLIGLLDGDRPVLGVIDQPITGERWVGVAGQGTEFHGPFGGIAGTRRCAALAHAELSATAPEMFTPDELACHRALAGLVRRVSWGGDCYAYGLLAIGQIDIIMESDLKPWDWAALLPVVEAAGGRLTDWQGNTLRLDGPGQVVAVGDPALLPHVVAALHGRGT